MAAFQHPVVNLENKPAGTVDLLPEVFQNLEREFVTRRVREIKTLLEER